MNDMQDFIAHLAAAIDAVVVRLNELEQRIAALEDAAQRAEDLAAERRDRGE